MVRDNFYGTPSSTAKPKPFEILSSLEEDNIPIAYHHHWAPVAADMDSSRGGDGGVFHSTSGSTSGFH